MDLMVENADGVRAHMATCAWLASLSNAELAALAYDRLYIPSPTMTLESDILAEMMDRLDQAAKPKPEEAA